MTGSPRKSTLVRMGTKVSTEALFREKLRLQDHDVTLQGDPQQATSPVLLHSAIYSPISPIRSPSSHSGAYVVGNAFIYFEFIRFFSLLLFIIHFFITFH